MTRLVPVQALGLTACGEAADYYMRLHGSKRVNR
jgi:hypothetical protein